MTLPGKQRKDRSDVGACQGGRKRHSASRGGCLPDLRRQRRREEERQTKPATTHDPRRCQLNHELVPAEENLNRIDSFLMIPASLFAEEPYTEKERESVNRQENTPYPANSAEYGVFIRYPILPDRCHNCNSFKLLSYEHPQNGWGLFAAPSPSGRLQRSRRRSASARGDRSLKTLRRSGFLTRPLMVHQKQPYGSVGLFFVASSRDIAN